MALQIEIWMGQTVSQTVNTIVSVYKVIFSVTLTTLFIARKMYTVYYSIKDT